MLRVSLREAMERRQIKRRQLAKVAVVNDDHITGWGNGHRKLTRRNADKLGWALQVDPFFLLLYNRLDMVHLAVKRHDLTEVCQIMTDIAAHIQQSNPTIGNIYAGHLQEFVKLLVSGEEKRLDGS